jgi:glyoxylate/hydroxypyruvate reductase A
MATLNYQRQLYRYQSNQKKKVWDMSNPELDLQVGVMGVGALGGDVIEKLKMLGFSVFGYGNSPKSSTDYPYFYGDELPQFLNNVNLIICMLPLTPSTENILNLDFFRKCKKGTYIINVARGSHLVEDDLVTAIGEGIISGAFLDVFRKEPLPQEHPFWNSDKITVVLYLECTYKQMKYFCLFLKVKMNLLGYYFLYSCLVLFIVYFQHFLFM